MGSVKFRVKRVPDPVAYIANKKEGLISKNELIAAAAIIPKMENFDFDIRYTITEFDFTAQLGGTDLITKHCSGGKLCEEMKRMIQGQKKGSKVFIEEIKAVAPGIDTRKLSPINLRIN